MSEEPKIIERRLKPSQLTKSCNSESSYAANAAKEYDLVIKAAEYGDAEAALRLYEKAIIERGEVIDALMRVLPMTTDGKSQILPRVDVGAIGAMERVALAAIDLARLHLISAQEKKK